MISKNLRHVEGNFVSLTDATDGHVVLTNASGDTIELGEAEVSDLMNVVAAFEGLARDPGAAIVTK